MRSFVFSLSLTFVLVFSLAPMKATAQIVSLLVDADEEDQSLKMEKALTKHLKEAGYEVKSITFKEGFFLYIQFMPITTVPKQRILGYAGNVFIGSQAWTKVVDSFMPSSCDMAFSQKMKNKLGVEMVLLDSQIFTDSSIEALAESISAKVDKILTEKSAEISELMVQLEEK